MSSIPKDCKDVIIFPLDVATLAEAEYLIGRLSGVVGVFKVGLELFVKAGPTIFRRIREKGDAKIFLDLKLHDIPVTVSRAMRVISDFGVDFTTIHCGESDAMLKAAVEGSNGRVKVLGVTVLTSVSSDDLFASGLAEPYAQDVAKLVLQRAERAKSAGCAGVVCSGHEVKMIKKTFGDDFIAVTPGIRPVVEIREGDDQKRVMTPEMAILNGADYLVIGRPIRDAEDPVAAAIAIGREISNAKAG